MDWLDWTVPLPGLVFLFTVIDPLPQRAREIFAGVVTWLWLVLLGVAFFVTGPKLGLLAALLATIALGILMQPLGLVLARRMRARSPRGDR